MLLYKAQNKQTNKDFFLLWINYSHILHWVLMLVRYGCIRPKSPPLCWKLWWIADCPPNCDFYRFWRTTVSRNSEIIIYRLSFCTISTYQNLPDQTQNFCFPQLWQILHYIWISQAWYFLADYTLNRSFRNQNLSDQIWLSKQNLF